MVRGLAKILAWSAAGLVFAAGVVVLAVWLGGGPALAWVLRHPVSTAIGRQVVVNGSIDLHWGRLTHFAAEDVHIANADWGTAPEMFSADRVEIDFLTSSLLRGAFAVQSITLDRPKLLLETSPSGKRNWDIALSSGAPQRRSQVPVLKHAAVERGEVVFRNGETSARAEIKVATLEFGARDRETPVKLAAEGSFQGRPLRLEATVGPFAHLRNPSEPYPLRVDGTLDHSRLVVEGTMQEPLDLAGADLRLSVAAGKLHELGSLLGVPMPDLPDVRGTAKLSGGYGKWQLNAMTLALGHSDLEGGLFVDTTAKVPYVRAELTSRSLDPADFKGLFGGTPAHSAAPEARPDDKGDDKGRVLPNTPINVSKLPGLNADLTFDGTQIKAVAGAPLERISLGLKLRDGDLSVNPLRFHAAQGDVDLSFHFTPFTNDTPPRLHADAEIRHVDLHKLLDHPGQSEILRKTAGIVGGFVKIDTTGVSVREMLGRMDGDAGLFMDNGRISQLLEQGIPLDVLGALGVYVSGDKPVLVNCLISRFAIKKGVAAVSTLLLDTADTVVTGEGSVNFPSETIFVTLTPYNKHFTAVALRVPVDIHGTFAAPTYDFRRGELAKRIGEALGLGVIFPPAAIVPLVDTGLGYQNACATSLLAKSRDAADSAGSGTSRK